MENLNKLLLFLGYRPLFINFPEDDDVLSNKQCCNENDIESISSSSGNPKSNQIKNQNQSKNRSPSNTNSSTAASSSVQYKQNFHNFVARKYIRKHRLKRILEKLQEDNYLLEKPGKFTKLMIQIKKNYSKKLATRDQQEHEIKEKIKYLSKISNESENNTCNGNGCSYGNGNNDCSNGNGNSHMEIYKYIIYIIISWMYTCFIFLLVSMPAIHVLYHIIEIRKRKNDTRISINYYYAFFIYHLIYPLQYIFAFIYFQNDHFEEYFLLQFNTKKEQNKALLKMNISLQIFAIFRALSDLFYLLYIDDAYFPSFNQLSKSSQIFVSILIIFRNYMISLVLGLNLQLFASIFYLHTEDIKKYVKQFKPSLFDELNLNSIMNDVNLLAQDINNSVNQLENIFTSFTILGALSFTLFFKDLSEGKFRRFPWLIYLIFMFMQIIYLYITTNIMRERNNLYNAINDKKIIFRFLRRKTLHDVINILHLNEDYDLLLLNIIEENATMLDWTILNNHLKRNWIDFKFLGVSLGDFGFVKKGLFFLFLFVLVNNILDIV